MSVSGNSDERLSSLADLFMARQRRGQNPSVEEYAAANPELADEIRLAFPGLLLIDELRPGSGDETGVYETASVVVRGARLERLGDFRVLREAGRGGMGVVYEAEQESLGRRVALKVLAAHAIPDAAQVRRFEREARAAAQLHHTNIVPVFGVGEQNGLHYYAMQFIPGLGLDKVIEEVKQLRLAASARDTAAPAYFPEGQGGGGPTAAGIAQSLATEALSAERPDKKDPSTIEPARPAERGLTAPSPRSSAESRGLSSDAALDASGMSSVSGSDSRYWRSVARVGLQVAQALDYAHNQGILHRDIKPANLLLDGQGTVWVADFGLAKAVEGEDLTHTGDIVGTIRYMAPERFHGQCDARSDIYALGLTLYEMVGLRPAFEQTGRQAQIRQVMEEEPARLRKLDPSIPRDLETVIQKAIARDPSGRYATAAALAEDLTLFLDDKPVRARDIGMLERSWKWARRRPAIAALLAGLVLAVLTGLAAVTWQWRAAVEARDLARVARDEARGNLKVAGKAVDTFFTAVSEETLLNEPGMQPLREKLLKLALPYYQEVATRGSDDPAVRIALANAYLNWGTIIGEIESKEESRRILQTAVTQFKNLREADPSDFEAERGLARSYQALAQQFLNSVYSGEGFEEALSAARVWEGVVRSRPNDSEARRMLGRSYDLAGILRSGKDMGASEINFGKAIEVLSEAQKVFPSDAQIQQRLAVAISNISVLYALEGDPGRGETTIGRSLEILRRLRDEHPSTIVVKKDLARTIRARGECRLFLGSLEGAGDDFEEALKVIESLVARNPEVSDYRYILGEACTYLGQVRVEQNQTWRARELIGKAILCQEVLLEQRPSMTQNTLTLFESRTILATIQRDAGRLDDAKRSFGDTFASMTKHFEALADKVHQKVYFHVLLESTLLECSRGGATAEKLRALVEALRGYEISVREHPEDSIVRCRAVTGYLAIGQLWAASGATTAALQNLNRAEELIAPGLETTPGHRRLRCVKSRLETARGNALYQSGQREEAIAAAKAAVVVSEKLAGEEPSYFYELACALALKARLSASDAESARAGVIALRKAVEFGFDNVYKLKNDEQLASIRPREDFQMLVRETEKKVAARTVTEDNRKR